MLVGQRHSARRGVAADAEVLCQRRDQLVVARSRSQQLDGDGSDAHVVAAFSSLSRFPPTRSPHHRAPGSGGVAPDVGFAATQSIAMRSKKARTVGISLIVAPASPTGNPGWASDDSNEISPPPSAPSNWYLNKRSL